jgi:preprotein translocase subunit YajC
MVMMMMMMMMMMMVMFLVILRQGRETGTEQKRARQARSSSERR